jgi:hypothetical protein
VLQLVVLLLLVAGWVQVMLLLVVVGHQLHLLHW